VTSLTAAELAAMRAVADDFLPDTCTIQTRTTTVDALGGISEGYANTYTGVACRIDPVSGSEGVNNLQIAAGSKWMLNIPYDQTITVTDRIIHSGTTYEVSYIWAGQSYATIRRAELRRIG